MAMGIDKLTDMNYEHRKPPILERLGFKTDNGLQLTSEFGRLFHRVAGPA